MSFFSGKKVLVTGAGGFIGSHLVEALVERGAVVTGTLSKRPQAKHFLKTLTAVRWLRSDLSQQEDADEAFKGQQLVFHAAAVVGGIEFNLKHPASIFRDNMAITFPVMEAARRSGVEKICLVSSACVYPRFCTLPTPEEEGFKDRPEPTNEGYGYAKRMLEFAGSSYAQEYGLDVSVARPYNAYGPRDNFKQGESHVIPGLIQRIVAGENPLTVWGDGRQTRSFLYVNDFVRGLLLTMEKSRSPQAINLGSPEEVAIGDLARMIAAIYGRLSGITVQIAFDPSKPTGQPRRQCDTGRATRELGFHATTPLADGLKSTVEWYLAHER